MIRFLFRRLAWSALVVWVVATSVFVIYFAVPRDVARLIAGRQASDQTKSRTFSTVCESVVKSYFDARTPRAREVAVLRPLMAGFRCSETTEGLQRFLIRMRQQLHHFSRQSTKLQQHPFNQQAFEPLADLTRFVARLSIELEKREIDSILKRTSAP